MDKLLCNKVQTNSPTHNGQIAWLSILRGMTILLVTMNHVQLLNVSTGECYQFIGDINDLFFPFRMPTFIIVSGALLYYSRISRGWKTLDLYKDKLVRLGLPLIFCTVLGNIMQILFNSFVKSPHEVTVETFLKSFVLVNDMAWPHRWYLMTLTLIMALYPLYTIKKGKWADCLMLIILFGIRCIDFGQWGVNDWFGIITLNHYLPYFYLGILIFKHKWYRFLAAWQSAAAFTLAYILLYICMIVPIPEVFTDNVPLYELLGVGMVMSISMQIERICPRAFKSYSGYIFQIYLFGIAFQAFIELIVWRAVGCPAALVIPFYILNIASGIYLPVIMSKVVERIPVRWIRLCFGLPAKQRSH